MSFKSIKEIIKRAESKNMNFYEIVLYDDIKERLVSKEDSISEMTYLYEQMINADNKYDSKLMSNSKLSGGDGEKISIALKEERILSGSFIGEVMERAIKMGESNACMKKIVAAPTAGSCGVLPSVLITYQNKYNIPKEKMIEAMYVAAGVGQVITYRASISGAEGGCQAEIGSASAMAAAALCSLRGADLECICHSSALALKGLLGLTCDPVAGLVEVPCIKRNVIGAVNAITSSDMAIAGIRSKIPPDEVIDAMKDIGDAMPTSLKETSCGGLAITPSAIKISKSLNK